MQKPRIHGNGYTHVTHRTERKCMWVVSAPSSAQGPFPYLSEQLSTTTLSPTLYSPMRQVANNRERRQDGPRGHSWLPPSRTLSSHSRMEGTKLGLTRTETLKLHKTRAGTRETSVRQKSLKRRKRSQEGVRTRLREDLSGVLADTCSVLSLRGLPKKRSESVLSRECRFDCVWWRGCTTKHNGPDTDETM